MVFHNKTSDRPAKGEGKVLVRERQKVKRLEETVDQKTRTRRGVAD